MQLQSSRVNIAKSVQCLLRFQMMHEHEGNNYNSGLSSRVCVFISAKCMNSPPTHRKICRTVTVIWVNVTRTGCAAAQVAVYYRIQHLARLLVDLCLCRLDEKCVSIMFFDSHFEDLPRKVYGNGSNSNKVLSDLHQSLCTRLRSSFARYDKQLTRISAEGNSFVEQVLMLPMCSFAVALSAASTTRVGNVVVRLVAEVVTLVVT